MDWRRITAHPLARGLVHVLRPLLARLRDLVPIVVVIGLFQTLVLRQPLPYDAGLVVGLALVVGGLTLFVVGLELALFPLGEQLAHAFAARGSLPWLVAFAFALGFGTTFAEPALIAIVDKAEELAPKPQTSGHASNAPLTAADARAWPGALLVRTTVALAVGSALVLGVLRIVLGWSIAWLMVVGYAVALVLTPLAPPALVALAYDSGGVTTSTITVPLTTALGVGLAASIRGRSPLVDGFGLIGLASLLPIVFVLVLGILWSCL
jgi:hypothetical protein